MKERPEVVLAEAMVEARVKVGGKEDREAGEAGEEVVGEVVEEGGVDGGGSGR